MSEELRRISTISQGILSLFLSFAHHHETLDFLEEQEKEGKILIIRPQVKVDVGRIEKDKAKLTVLYKQGFHDGGQMIETMREYLEK